MIAQTAAACYGLTIQISLLVAPVLVIVSALIETPMNLVWSSPLELIAIGAVVFAINRLACYFV